MKRLFMFMPIAVVVTGIIFGWAEYTAPEREEREHREAKESWMKLGCVW